MEQEVEEWDQSKPIPFQETGSVLTTLGFLPATLNPDDDDFSKFGLFWELVRGKERDGVSVGDLLYVLNIIRGAKFTELEVAAPEDRELAKNITDQAFLDEEELKIVKGGQKKIMGFFKNFWVNRLLFEGDQGKKRLEEFEKPEEAECTDRPYVSDKSRELAEKRQQK